MIIDSIGASQDVVQACHALLVTSYKSLNLSESMPPPLKNEKVEPKVGPSSLKTPGTLEGKSEPLHARSSHWFETLSFQYLSKLHLLWGAPSPRGKAAE